ncbi:MAG: DUF2165 domain-containing protein [Pseudomonadales bacterium]|nr:DUF2165 domain-containing protein [Pseudomonadales bacterium]
MDVNALAKALVLLGLGSWLLLAAINNLIDPKTNITLIKRMMSMDAIAQDGVLGQGLLNRAVNNLAFLPLFLRCIAFYQLLISLSLIIAGCLFLSLASHLWVLDQSMVISVATLSTMAFLSLWFFFLVGGLWFGYWLKMGTVQMVHFTLLLMGMLLLLIIQL